MEIIIDGEQYECQPGQKVYDVAEENGIHIPTLCYNHLIPEIRPGACRICVVEVVNNGKETQLESSCTLPVSEGLEVSTNSQAVYDERRQDLELMLSEHEQDCRNCVKSGNCNFAELCLEYDIDGVSICAECPKQESGCFLSRGVLCLGPITHAGCDAFCLRKDEPCEGCFSLLSDESVLKFGIEALKETGFDKDEVLEAVKIFSFDGLKRLEMLMEKEGWNE